MKAERVYFTVEGPNDRKLAWKIAGGLAFSFVVSLLIIVCVLYADVIDNVFTFFASMAFYYPVFSGFTILLLVCELIYLKVRK